MSPFDQLLLLLFLVSFRPVDSLSGELSRSKEPIGDLLLRGVSTLVGQKYEPESITPPEYKEFALNDTSNDDILAATTQEIILRSGYNYENHQVLADDGYITTMVRIMNPLADRTKLKWPPVMLVNGGIVDQKVWIWCSAIQHHPEKFPRTAADGPITSSNRSIGFTLANNGYDVWLVGTRGSNGQNQGHLKFKNRGSLIDLDPPTSSSKSESRARSGGEQRDVKVEKSGREDFERDLLKKVQYWDYSMDDKAQFELPRQIDKVLKLTGSPNVSLVVQSFSSAFAIMMLAEQPSYSSKIHATVVEIPVLNNRGTNRFISLAQGLFKFVPSQLGTILITEILLPLLRAFTRASGRKAQTRYLFVKLLDVLFTGANSRYANLLEPAVYGNIFLPNSFKEIKHYCQIVYAARLQKFDYGPLKNKKIYGTLTPRPYDTTKIDLGNWLAISAENDALGPPSAAEQFFALSKTPPVEHIKLKHYNHLSAIAAFDIDKTVSLPILHFMDRFHLASPAEMVSDQEGNSIARSMREEAESASKFGPHLLPESPGISSIMIGHAKRNSIPTAES